MNIKTSRRLEKELMNHIERHYRVLREMEEILDHEANLTVIASELRDGYLLHHLDLAEKCLALAAKELNAFLMGDGLEKEVTPDDPQRLRLVEQEQLEASRELINRSPEKMRRENP